MISYLLWASLAFCLITWAIVLREQAQFWQGKTIRTTGVITDYAASTDGDGTSWRARVAFSTDTGQQFILSDIVLKPAAGKDIGGPVQVLYPDGRPELARVAHPLLRLLVHAVLALLTGIVCARLAGFLN